MIRLTSADTGRDHRLLLGKFIIKMPIYIPRIPKYELRYNIDYFKQVSVKFFIRIGDLYPKYNIRK